MGARTAWLGLGGNLGDVRSALAAALKGLDAQDGVSVLAVSPLYKTPPWGLKDQPWFLNCCAGVSTTLAPEALLEVCQQLERVGLRERTVRWGPRTVDIDIIAYEGVEQVEQRLTLPHPRAVERAFVLTPLAAIAPDVELAGQTVAALAAALNDPNMEVAVAGGEWWREEG
ncbi:MAG: 2-amino-4-hydroxy-6-hydroxymethyldihydropteridine diphosphokinase [Pseudomonadota bacterium]